MIFSLGLFLIGAVLFPFSHTLITYLLKFVLKDLKYVDRFGISTRFVLAFESVKRTSSYFH